MAKKRLKGKELYDVLFYVRKLMEAKLCKHRVYVGGCHFCKELEIKAEDKLRELGYM